MFTKSVLKTSPYLPTSQVSYLSVDTVDHIWVSVTSPKVNKCVCAFKFHWTACVCVGVLTGHGKSSERASLRLGLTHPLLAAFPWQLHPPGHRAVWARQHHAQVAARHTGNLAVATHALVLAAGEKGLPVLVDWPIQQAHIPLISCWRRWVRILGQYMRPGT